MKRIESHRHGDTHRGALSHLASGLIQESHAFFQPCPRVTDHPLKGRPGLEQSEPGLPFAVGASLTRDPHHTVRFHYGQHRHLVKKNFIEAQGQHSRATSLIQHCHDAASLLAALLHPPAHCGPTGHPHAREHHREDRHDGGEAQPHGEGRRSQFVLLTLGQCRRLC